jgi:pimeloyl-ACP methyl ester carboxylesterase
MPATTTNLIHGWSSLSLDDIDQRLQSGDAEMTRFFGAEETAAMRSLPTAQTRSFGGPRPAVVILPGIMGSLLQSTQGLIDLLWVNPVALLRGRVNLLEMDDAGERESDPHVYVTPTSLEMIYYTKFVLSLGKQVDLFQFPYDWRRDIQKLAGDLHAALERWAAGSDRKFTLVGHSMGGLVSRAYMALYPDAANQRIKRLVMLGTPNHGAPETVRNLIQGNDLMNLAQKLNSNNDANNLVRHIPSIYQILPAPPSCWPDPAHYPTDFDVYSAGAWPIAGLNQRFLDMGSALWNLLAAADPQIPQTMIAGCNLDTTTGVRITGGVQIERGSAGMAGGDGTVALVSALLPGADTYYVECVHAKLPGHADVIQAVLDLASGGSPSLSKEVLQPTGAAFATPAPTRAALATPPPTHGTSSTPPPIDLDTEAARLRRQISNGTLTAQEMERLYFLL